MFQAILHGKAGRIERSDGKSVSWSSLFKEREDLLTAAFFTRFSYLSIQTQEALLNRWFNSNFSFGESQGVDFWPSYTLEKNGSNSRVEPDLVLKYQDRIIIVEVKPPKGGVQYFSQWEREIDSFLESDEDDSKPVLFLGIGRVDEAEVSSWREKLLGKGRERLERVEGLVWQNVAESVVDYLHIDNGIREQDRNILVAMLEALAFYGLKTSSFTWSQLIQPSGLSTSISELTLDHQLLVDTSVRVSRNWIKKR